jgi:uncharacterized membrane protein YqhA
MSLSEVPKRYTPMTRAFRVGLFVVELGVLSSFAFALMLFISSVVQTFVTLRDAVGRLGDEESSQALLVSAIEQADTLLVATALLIISLGLQSLFIGRVEGLPNWLTIRTFDDLKGKLLSVIVVALAVKFFSFASKWKGGMDILLLGGTIALVILAIAAYGSVLERSSSKYESEEPKFEAGVS